MVSLCKTHSSTFWPVDDESHFCLKTNPKNTQYTFIISVLLFLIIFQVMESTGSELVAKCVQPNLDFNSATPLLRSVTCTTDSNSTPEKKSEATCDGVAKGKKVGCTNQGTCTKGNGISCNRKPGRGNNLVPTCCPK